MDEERTEGREEEWKEIESINDKQNDEQPNKHTKKPINFLNMNKIQEWNCLYSLHMSLSFLFIYFPFPRSKK